MKVSDLVNNLGLVVYSGKKGLERSIKGGYASDLLSDVMGNAKEGQVWVTLQTHKNVAAIASLKDLAAVILVKGNRPDEDTAQHSDEEGVPVLGTDQNAFEITGQFYEKLKADGII
ncbi:MAG: serine kinase [Bacteroidales bacterium]|nr:serine kinase [Bacteroidales bacterium]